MIEVANAKGVAYQTVWRAISRGQLPARRVGRTVVVSSEAARAWTPCYDRIPLRFRGQPRTPRPQARPAHGIRALVADDDLLVRELLVQIMTEEGVPVVAVGDGEAAALEAQRQAFSHVFLDVRMPRGNGAAALPAIREACPKAVIAFVTAHSSDLAAIEWPKAWPVVIIPKPFDLDQIVDVLRMSVGDRSLRPRAARAATVKAGSATQPS